MGREINEKSASRGVVIPLALEALLRSSRDRLMWITMSAASLIIILIKVQSSESSEAIPWQDYLLLGLFCLARIVHFHEQQQRGLKRRASGPDSDSGAMLESVAVVVKGGAALIRVRESAAPSCRCRARGGRRAMSGSPLGSRSLLARRCGAAAGGRP